MNIKPFEVVGNGSSLWGKSKGTYTVTKGEVGYIDWVSWPEEAKSGRLFASVNLYGDKTDWYQYTDTGIQKDINENVELKEAVWKEIVDMCKKANIKECVPKTMKLSWSEQGLQPDGGWNFDVCIS